MMTPAGRRERRRLLRQVLIPVVLLVVVGMTCNLLMAMRAGAELDEDSARAQRQIVTSVSKRLLEKMHQFVADYSYWDEFYEHAQKGIKADWAEANLGPYMSSAFDISQVWVVGGGIEYGWSASASADAFYRTNPDLAEMVEAARAQPPGIGSSPVSAYVIADGSAYLAAAAVIAPVSRNHREQAHGPAKVFLAISPLTDEVYGQVAADFNLSDLRFVTASPGDDVPSVALSDVGRRTIGYLAWHPPAHMATFLDRYWPASVAVLVVLGTILAFLAVRWARMIETMQTVSRSATAAARESRAKSIFIANMSHELRTPLNAVIGFSELMSTEALGPHQEPRYKEYAGDILASGRHLLTIINDVLAVAKIEAGQYRFDPEDCAVDEVLEDIVRAFEGQAAERGITLVPGDCPARLVIRADAKALRQVLTNVMSNAMKFTQRGGRVSIACTESGDRIAITISDTGIGIPADKLVSLGTPFFQVSDLLTRNEGGMGLGLSIVHGMMVAMQGRITIESEEGVGTSVRLIFRAADSDYRTVLAA